MPSAFTHAIAALATGKICLRKSKSKILIAGMICSTLPDLDAIGFWLGVPYQSVLGHRGITHSFLFALLLSFTVVISFFRSGQLFNRSFFIKWVYLFLATASHPLLDALTNGGLGVAFFAPFENNRYFFPYRPVLVAPISVSGFFTKWGLAVFKSEFKWIWIPSILIILVFTLIDKGKKSERSKPDSD